MIDPDELEKTLKNAYRKWKSAAYFDKYQSNDVRQIAEFEYENNLHDGKYFSDLAYDLIDNERRTIRLDNVIKSIDVRCYPKKIKENSEEYNIENAPQVISNLPPNKIEVNKLQYRIQLTTEAHILGVLWIMKFGDLLDQNLDSQCYGNRLRENIYNKKDGDCTSYLFFPYFKKYESWRDTAINVVEKLLDVDLNVAMITLDIENYFYNCRVNFSSLNQDLLSLRNENNKEIFDNYNFLNKYIEDVFTKYSSFFVYKPKKTKSQISIKNPFIPIGFLPSNIISNWYLSKFDKEVRSQLNPEYYGRYVDDILMVFSINNENLKEKEILDQLIRKPSDIILPKLKNNTLTPLKSGTYSINKKYLNKAAINLPLNPSKVKIFYFSHQNSRKVIDSFKETIKSQASVFTYLHEDEKVFLNDLPNKVWQLNYDDSPNKIRSVKSLKLDKFNLSKWLAFLVNFSNPIETPDLSQIAKTLFETLSSTGYIENYPFWEKYILFFFKQNKPEFLLRFCKELLFSIKNIDVKIDNKYQLLSTYNQQQIIIKNFFEDFLSVLKKTLSLRDQNRNKDFLQDFNIELDQFIKCNNIDLSMSDEYWKYFLSGYLFNTLITPFPLKKFVKYDNYDLLADSTPYSDDDKLSIDHLLLFPRYIHFNELQFLSLGFPVPDLLKENNYDEIWKWFCKINYDSDNISKFKNSILLEETLSGGNPKIKKRKMIIGDLNENQKLRIGIANITIKEELYIDKLKGKTTFNQNRESISNLINDAIEQKVDLLVLPECLINYQWINKLIKVSRDHQMGMVFGLEYIIDNNIAYNYLVSLLPFKLGQFNNCAVEFRLKNHYSPAEKKYIQNYYLSEPKFPKKYSIYKWKNLCFAPYCCYEIVSIEDRALFKSLVDAIIIVEWNRDIGYFSNIIESLTRDLHCYCIQSNSSNYGDNRITQPTSYEYMDIIKAKGGINDYIIVADIDIMKLREFQIKGLQLQKDDGSFKQTPPDFDIESVRKRSIREF